MDSFPAMSGTVVERIKGSQGQQALWFVRDADPHGQAYNIHYAWRFHSNISVSLLRRAVACLVDHHPGLRATYVNDEHGLDMLIHANTDLPFEESTFASNDPKQVQAFIDDELLRPFNLANEVPIRFHLISTPAGHKYLSISAHHILIDGAAIVRIINDLALVYQQLSTDLPALLPQSSRNLKAAFEAQEQYLQSEQGHRDAAFWQSYLAGPLPQLSLPTDKNRPDQLNFQVGFVRLPLPPPLIDAFRSTAKEQLGVPPLAFALAAYELLLWHYSQQDDFLIGIPVSGRNEPNRQLIGYFVNTLVVRASLHPNQTFSDLVRQTAEAIKTCRAHDQYPFGLTAQNLSFERDPACSPIIQTCFTWDNYNHFENRDQPMIDLDVQDREWWEPASWRLERLPIRLQNDGFDLSLRFTRAGGGYYLTIAYGKALFERATVTRMAANFAAILDSVARNPESIISAVPAMSTAESELLLKQWQPNKSWPSTDTIPGRIAAQTERSPEQVALVFPEEPDDRLMSYSDMQSRVNQLAHHLISRGIPAEAKVAVLMSRSPELVIAQLAVMLSGAAYLPLDPAYPRDRLSFMLKDAEACLVLCDSDQLHLLPEDGPPTLLLSRDWQPFAKEPKTAPAVSLNPRQLAYVIYTSGSTGQPKGVQLEHRQVIRLLDATQDQFNFDKNDVWSFFHSHAFDFSVWEIWGALCTGGRLLVVPYLSSRDPQSFVELVSKYGVTVLNQTPSAFRSLMAAQEGMPLLASLRTVIFGGEALDFPSLAPWFKRYAYNRPQLVNMYGITETCVHVTYLALDRQVVNREGSHIGKPIEDLQLFVLNQGMMPTPIGVTGEMFVGGAGLARGYLKRPALTASRFLPNPFSTLPGERLYRSGDLAKFMPTGDLVYLGRIDHQVKLRGFRIELEEIAHQLEQLEAVQRAIVLVQEASVDDDQQLLAFVVPNTQNALDSVDLKRTLARVLPDYMVPDQFIPIQEVPLTANGKTDRRALLTMEKAAPIPSEIQPVSFEAPRNEPERRLAELFAGILKREPIGIHDHFFELGGHSLKATRLITRIRQQMGAALTVQDLFRHPTVAALAGRLFEVLLQGQRSEPQTPMLPARPARLPLSSGQRSLWFLQQTHGHLPVYHLPQSFYLDGWLCCQSLYQAMTSIANRHEALRTSFRIHEDQPEQRIADRVTLPFHFLDLVQLPRVEAESMAQHLYETTMALPFDLSKPPLMRACLVRFNPRRWLLLLSLHHIIADGASMEVFFREWIETYRQILENRHAPADQPHIHMADFAVWEAAAIAANTWQPHRQFWREQLADAPAVLDLPSDYQVTSEPGFAGGSIVFSLSDDQSAALTKLAQSNRISLFALLLAAYKVVLARITSKSACVVGCPVANRGESLFEETVGYLTNVIALHTDLAAHPTFLALARHIASMFQEAQANEAFPLNAVLDDLNLERLPNRHPLFQVMFSFSHDELADSFPGLTMERSVFPRKYAHFELTLDLRVDSQERLHGILEYHRAFFTDATAQVFADFFQALLKTLIQMPDPSLSSLVWNSEETLLPNPTLNHPHHRLEAEASSACLITLLAEQVARTPAGTAVEHYPRGPEQPAQVVDYATFQMMTNRLAHMLRDRGIGPETRVISFMQRSFEVVAGLWSILKAGGTYVPLDPDLPRDRMQTILDDTKPTLILTCKELLTALPETSTIATLTWETISQELTQYPEQPLSATPDPQQLAYIIFTSGSTGKPKGVGIPYGVASRHLFRIHEQYDLGPGDRRMQFFSLSFDPSMEEMVCPLVCGATLVVLPPDPLAPARFSVIADRLKLTMADFPTAYFHEWAHSLKAGDRAPSELRCLLVGGEALSREAVQAWHNSSLAHVAIYNAYGPTEATITATLFPVLKNRTSTARRIPLGQSLPGRVAHIVDRSGRRQLPGIPGELVLGGPFLARGYLDQPAMTAERFVPDPFSGQRGTRLYRTGDLARQLPHDPEGHLDFLGRVDRQIKLRGFRIELGEIETCLNSHPAIEQCVVIVRRDFPGGMGLLAYWTPSNQTAEPPLLDLQTFAAKHLPSYMVPTAFEALEAFPLNQTGKINMRALGVRPLPELGEQPECTPPRNETEHRLADIWRAVLSRDQVGIHQNFFDLGGHSLLAMKIASAIREGWSVDIPLRRLFQQATIASLAEELNQDNAHRSVQHIPHRTSEAPLPLSAGQHRFWVLDQYDPGKQPFNLPVCLQLQGPLDTRALADAVAKLFQRHDILRTSFPCNERGPCQQVHDSLYPEMTLVDFSNQEPNHDSPLINHLVEHAFTIPFNLEQAPLARLHLCRLHEQDHVLIFMLHHILCDGWSVDIIQRELSLLYNGLILDQKASLPKLAIQYADFAAWQYLQLEQSRESNEATYWLDRLKGDTPYFPLDFKPASEPSFAGDSLTLTLSPQIQAQLNEMGQEHRATLFMILLTAFKAALYRHAGLSDSLVGIPSSQRNHAHLEPLIGFFVNTLVIRTAMDEGQIDFSELLRRVSDATSEALDHGNLPFDRLITWLNPKRQGARHPLFQTMFVYDDQGKSQTELLGGRSQPIQIPLQLSLFDLTLSVSEQAQGLKATFLYQVQAFERKTIEALAVSWRQALQTLLDNPRLELRQFVDFSLPNPATPEPSLQPESTITVQAPETSPITQPSPSWQVSDGMPIGRAIAQASALVIDPYFNLAPRGVQGEICIGGPGLARGYLNRPAMTASRFVPDPFGGLPGTRLYRTGDLGIFDEADRLHFAGRVDHQLKIRGFRVEPGEIERCLNQFPDVEQSQVLAREITSGNLQLLAYVTASPGYENRLQSRSILNRLSDQLPKYMVPNHVTILPNFPLTTQGKIDRKALPNPGPSEAVQTSQSTPELPEKIGQMLAIWREIMGRPNLSCKDHFFEFGGHSLMAVQLTSKIKATFGVELTIRHFFQNPTVVKLLGCGLFELNQEELTFLEPLTGPIESPVVLPPAEQNQQPTSGPTQKSMDHGENENQSSWQLSYAQEQLWFLHQLERGEPNYQLPAAIRLDGWLSVTALFFACQKLLEHHAILRASFSEGPIPEQYLNPRDTVPLVVLDYEHFDHVTREMHMNTVIHRETLVPFFLSKPPLVRFFLFRLSENQHLFFAHIHHILTDGWSVGIMFRDLARLYEHELADHQSREQLSVLKPNYFDYAVWQKNHLSGDTLEKLLTFWCDYLGDSPPTLNLPTDFPCPLKRSMGAGRIARHWGKQPTRVIEAFGHDQLATSFMTILAGFKVLLARFCNQADITIGTPVANRDQAQWQDLIGFFVNTLILRTRLTDEVGYLDFRRLVARVRQHCLDAFSHQELPFEKLVEALQPERVQGQTPIFRVLFQMQDHTQTPPGWPGARIGSFEFEDTQANFDLTVTVIRQRRGLSVYWNYTRDLFREETIEGLARCFHELLPRLISEPDRPVNRIRLLKPSDFHQLEQLARGPALSTTTVDSVPYRFAEVVKKFPSETALVQGEFELSYRDLDVQSNRLAAHLKTAGLQLEEPVIMCMSRGCSAVITMLAILKAGGSYLPLDVDLPTKRIELMLADANARILIHDAALPNYIRETALLTIQLSHQPEITFDESADSFPELSPSQIAYTMYTSGSTGRAKGVRVTHRGILDLVQAELTPTGPSMITLQIAPLGFDAATWEIWTPLLTGGQLIIFDHELPTVEFLTSYFRRFPINSLYLNAALFHALLDTDPQLFANLEYLICGGEVLSTTHVRRLQEFYPELQLINGYGPTENTTFSTMFSISLDSFVQNIPIGSPLPGSSAWVVDQHLNPVPLGVEGELLLGGTGLARDYVNCPALTAEKFIPHPFPGEDTGARLYRSGDLAKLAGNPPVIQFLGRRDAQIKLRGLRIELTEIELALMNMEGIEQAVVLMRKLGTEHYLIAYLTTAKGFAIEKEAISCELSKRLPTYMIPGHFVHLTDFPKTTTGKIDRKAFPDPQIKAVTKRKPRSTVEHKLVRIWIELLGCEVGVEDGFFQLGGHSLLAVRLIDRIHQEFGISLPLATLYSAQTVAELAPYLNGDQDRDTQADQVVHNANQPTSQPENDLLIPLRVVDKGVPIILIHPIGGHLFAYQTLLSLLPEHLSVYGIQAPTVPCSGDAPKTVESIANLYIERMMSHLDTVPLLLGGWSFGGVIAYEMAIQCHTRGQPISQVLLLDSWLVPKHYPVPNRAEVIREFCHDILLSAGFVEVTDILANMAWLEETWLGELSRRLLEHPAFPLELTEKTLTHWFDLFRRNYLAFRTYQPTKSYPGPVQLIKACDPSAPEQNSEHPNNGWEHTTSPRFQVSQIAANHYQLMGSPFIDTAADWIGHQLPPAEKPPT